jgi:hypothetical protein
MEDVGILYGDLVHFTANWCILWPFCIFYGYLVLFSHFGMLHQEKSGNPVVASRQSIWKRGLIRLNITITTTASIESFVRS